MICAIVIAGIVAFRQGSSPPNAVVIYGSAVDCAAVDVRIQPPSGPALATTATVDQAGGWSAEFSVANGDFASGDFTCGAQSPSLDVAAACQTDPACSAGVKFDELPCQETGACPRFEKLKADVIDARASGCDSEGRRLVRFRAEMTPPPASGQVVVVQFRVRLAGEDEVVSLDSVLLTATGIVESETRLEGGEYGYELRIVAPSPCPGPTGSVSVPACPVPTPDDPAEPTGPVCPIVTFERLSAGTRCDLRRRRSVTVTARLTPVPGNPVSASLVLVSLSPVAPLQPIVLQTLSNQSSEFTLTGSVSVPAGIDYRAEVRLSDPDVCNVTSAILSVPPCPGVGDDGEDEEETPPPPPPPPPPPSPIQWCIIWLVVSLAMMVVGAFTLGIAMCVLGIASLGPQAAMVATVIAVIGGILLALGTLSLLIWLFVCASCRQNCSLLDFLIEILLFLVAITAVLAIIGAVLAWLNISSLCWVGWLIATADFGLMLFIAVWYARFVGCRPWPEWWPEALRTQIPDAMRLVCDD